MLALYRACVATDASLLEINPLIVTETATLALDAKMAFDDNALFRHPTSRPARHERRGSARGGGVEVQPELHQAGRHHRCMVKAPVSRWRRWTSSSWAGGEPANFLDVGGGATRANQERLPHPHGRQGGHGRPDQYLWRHPPLRRFSLKGSSRRSRTSASPCRSSSVWKAPTSRRASNAEGERPHFETADDMNEPRAKSGGGEVMSVLIDKTRAFWFRGSRP